MKKHLIALAAALILLPAIAEAQAPQYPQTLPPNTVIGRTGIGRGPAQAITFDALRTFIGSAVTIGGSAGPTFTLDPTLKMTGSILSVVVGTSGNTIPLNNGNNIFSGNVQFGGSAIFNGSITLPNQPAYSWLLNNTSGSAPPTPVTIGALTPNGAPDATGTTVPCETAGVLGKCTAGSLAGSLTAGIVTFGGSSGPNITIDSASLAMTGTNLAVKTGTSGAAIPFLDGTNVWSGGQTFQSSVQVGSVATATTPGISIGSSSASVAQNIGQDTTHNLALTWNYNATAASASANIGTYGSSNPLNIDASTLKLQSAGVGNVMVGAGTPTAKLDVNGSVRIRSLTAGCVKSDSSGNMSNTACGSVASAIYVTDYAVCDASTDDTTALQAAINATPSGGTLIFPAGNRYCSISASVSISSSIKVQGNGSCIYNNNHNINMLVIDTTPGDIYYLEIDNLCVYSSVSSGFGTTVVPAGIQIAGNHNFFRSSITRLHSRGNYFGIASAPTVTQVAWLSLKDNMFDNDGSNNHHNAILMAAPMGISQILDNRIVGIYSGGIGVYIGGAPSGDIVIANNQIEGSSSGDTCLQLNPTSYGARFQVTGNKMDTCTNSITTTGVSGSGFINNGFAGGRPMVYNGTTVTSNSLNASGLDSTFINNW